MRRLIPSMQVMPARDIRSLKPEETNLYLWNAQPPDFDLPIGSPIDPDLLQTIPTGFPLRLFVVDSERWQNELTPDLTDPSIQKSDVLADAWHGDRYQELLSPIDGDTSDSSSSPSSELDIFVRLGSFIFAFLSLCWV